MVDDIVRSLGFLTVGTRLKRLGERMQAHTQRILHAHELAIQAGQFPFLAAIARLGPLTVGEVAEAVGVTQPGATRTLAQLAEAGLIKISQTSADQRRKSVALTKPGQRLVDHGQRLVWPLIEGAVKELCVGLSGSLLEQLTQIEDGLEAQPLDRRAASIRARRR